MNPNLKDIVAISKSLKLLYVEDNEEVREQTLKMLDNFFDTIVTATDGRDGLSKYKKANGTYDLIISDVNMPHLDGVNMSKAILELDEKQLIVIITAHNEPEQIARLDGIGIVNYLHKPVEFKQFIDVLSEAINKYKEIYEIAD